MPKKYLFFVIMILFSILFFPSCGDSSTYTLDLSGKWDFIDRDDPALFQKTPCGMGPATIMVPGDWYSTLSRNRDLTSYVWLRKNIIIGNEYRSVHLSFILNRIGIADEVYCNGVMIGQSGIIPPPEKALYYFFSWQNPRIYYIPPSIIKFGKKNCITIRVFSHVINGISGRPQIASDSGNGLINLYTAYSHLIISVLALSFNFLFFIILMVMFLAEIRRREFLYISLIALLTLAGNLVTLDTPFLINGLIRYKIFLVIYTAANLCVFIATQEFFKIKSKALTIAAFLLYLGVGAALIAAPDTQFLITLCGPLAIGFILIMITASTVVFFLAIKRDPRKNWYFLLIAIPLPLSVARNSYYLLSIRFNELPNLIFLHVPAVFLVILLYMIYSYTAEIKKRGTLYRALLRKTRRIERMLKLIQRDRVKPGPRDIIHEVIEYLDENFNERYERRELAQRFDINEDYMGQLFKRTTGKNISSYINANRVEAAKNLLIETDSRVIDIAYHVGFDNLTHFHRLFKKETGLTPNGFREQMAGVGDIV